MLRSSAARLAFATFSLLSSCSPSPESGPHVVYGDDDRRDLFQATDTPMMVEAARSTAALFDPYFIQDQRDGTSKIRTTIFGRTFELCRSEPFYAQPTGAKCSGFLVGPNLMVTAGHCIKDIHDCHGSAFVFGYS